MLCAHTVRRLKPGTTEKFIDASEQRGANPPAGWIRFHALRGLDDEDEVVVTYPLVEAVVANGVYEVTATWTAG
jgi:heme-degrading monooxygenase HmoA